MGEEPLGACIKQWRTNMGLTAVECAKRAGIAEHTWRRVENGSTEGTKMDTVRRMLAAMNAQLRIEFASKEHAWIEQSKEASDDDSGQAAPDLGSTSP